jgi:hypothetical protein
MLKISVIHRRAGETPLCALDFVRWLIHLRARFSRIFVCCNRESKSTVACSFRAFSPFHEFLPGAVVKARSEKQRPMFQK